MRNYFPFSNRFSIQALLLMLVLTPFISRAQTSTRNDGSTTSTDNSKKTKILIIPWEPTMFNCSSDISKSISTETSQKYDQIQETFRRGMVEQLKHAFGANYSVISLLDDTAKMKVDLYFTYQHTAMSYTPVNAPLNPTKADSAKMKQQSGIQKGQIAVQTDEGEKFMNTIILSPNMMAYLKKKYNADYVIFLNEIDMDNDLGADPYNKEGKTDYNRSATLHWTIFSTATGKRVAMGKNKAKFSSAVNSPKKIIDGSFNLISKSIYDKFIVGIKPKQ